jgi:hypothetical protein
MLKIRSALAIALLSLSAAASAATPVVDARQARQDVRIDAGVASGRLTPRETAALDRQQHRIDRAEARAEADGVVTRGERVHLHRRLNASSHSIYRAKRNRW